jgi:hypothetical protein
MEKPLGSRLNILQLVSQRFCYVVILIDVYHNQPVDPHVRQQSCRIRASLRHGARRGLLASCYRPLRAQRSLAEAERGLS